MHVKKLPIGIQTFRKLIEQNYLYIDKTQSIHRLLTRGGHYYFLSRPRRFGKSLLVSTLKEIFSGNRELFKDLWIYDKIRWTPHPVIHLDFLNISYKTPEILEKSLGDRLVEIASENGIQLPADFDSKAKFARLIKELSGKGDVVILVDEYDKPIIDFIDQPAVAKRNRDYLKDFYGVLKGSDQYIRFAFLTGVSKFSKVSVFSDLNNLDDITLDESFSTLLGCTEEELLFYFEDRIKQLADKTNEPASGNERTLREIREWYNGYSWDGAHFIYNPLSLLNLFSRLEYDNYWFTTGTPAFLIKTLKERGINIREFESVEVDSSSFETYDIENIGSVSLLFQTGYLTVKKKTIATGGGETLYRLSYPNKEVRDSFLKHFLDSYTPREARENASQLRKLKTALSTGNTDEFFNILKSLFASISYDMAVRDREGYYQTIIYLVLRLVGVDILAEQETNTGRIDGVIETGKFIYLMEYKIGKAQDAMAQIKAKKYHEKYLASGKDIILIGVGFNPEQKNIGDYLVESLKNLIK